MKFGNNIDLDWNQLQNARLQNLSSVPISKDSAEEGYIYYNTAQHRAQLYVKKVSGNSVVIDDWYNLLLGRENEIDPSWLQGGIGIGKLGCVLYDSDTNYLNSFAANENNLIPTTGAIYGFFKDALKRNDAMVYMGTFTGQASTSTTVSASSFTLSAAYGGGSPTALSNFNGLSKGATFKVVAPATNPPATMYFGNIKVEAGDMIIVGEDFTSSATTAALSKFDLIQLNLTNYVTTFGGRTGAITVRGVDGVAESTTVGDVNFTLSNGLLAGTVVRDTPVVTWTGGTTAGPTLKVKAMGNTSAAVAIPSASSTASGVVTTDDQTFTGVKSFAKDILPAVGQTTVSNTATWGDVFDSTTTSSLGSNSKVWSQLYAGRIQCIAKVKANHDSESTSERSLVLTIRTSTNNVIGTNDETVQTNCWRIYSYTSEYSTTEALGPILIGGSSSSGLYYTGSYSILPSARRNRWGLGTLNPNYFLHVNGTFGAGNTTIDGTLGVTGATTLNSTLTVNNYINLTGAATNGTKRIYFGSTTTGSPYLEWDSTNNALHAVNMGFYADSWVASGGIGSGSGGSGGGSNIQLLNLSQCRSLASESAGSGKAAAAWAIKQLDTDYSSKYNNLVSSINTLRQDVNSISASGVVSVSSPTASNTGYLVTSVTKASDSTAISVTKVDIGSYSLTLNGGTAVSLIKTGSGNSSASFFAPTTVGTAGQVLLSGGSTTSNGVTTYNPPTWGYADRIKTSFISSNITDGLNNQAETAGLFVCPFSFDANKEDKNTPTGISAGVILRWNRYLNKNDGTINTEVQLLTTTSSNRLWFRNSWSNSSSSSTDKVSIVWKDWLEVATIGTNGNFGTALGNSLNTALNSKFIHTYNVGRSISGASSRWDSTNSTTGYKTYTTVHEYDNSNLIVALYDNENKLVMTDVEIHLYDGSTESYVGKYGVRLSFAKPFPTGVTYKLVVYGTQNS